MRKSFRLLFVFAFMLLLSTAQAAVPHLINYQGQLTDKDNKPLKDSYVVTFRVYDAENGGNLLSEELFSSVQVEKGVFSVLLGSGIAQASLPQIGALAFDKPYFLEIKVGEEIITPRQRLTSTGYALKAEKAETADSVKAGSIDRNALAADVSASLMPAGTIVMWSGTLATIPSGWVLCDGTNGTPDLRDRFIFSAGNLANPGNKNTITLSGSGDNIRNDSGSNSKSDGGGTCTGQHRDMMPPYFALAFIMKQ